MNTMRNGPPLLFREAVVKVQGFERFVAPERFRIGELNHGRISVITAEFSRRFILNPRIEEAVPEAEVGIYGLYRGTNEVSLVSELNKMDPERRMTLSYVWRLVELQADGREGPLRVNAAMNLAFISDKSPEAVEILSVVRFSLQDDGWRFDAGSVSADTIWTNAVNLCSL